MGSDGLALARITPAQRIVSLHRDGLTRRMLSPREKAAVLVRWILSQGGQIPLTLLSEQMQAELAEQMGELRLIDKETLEQVVSEFSEQLEQVGIAFSGGLEGALSVMDGHISQTTASRLRRKASVGAKGDPWERLVGLPTDKLLPILESESVEVAAVILSKLQVPRAAEILGKLPGDRARRMAFAVSQTGNVDPETVRRIGIAVLSQIDSQPPKAFDRGPVERVGAILNVASATMREDVLKGLEEEDSDFADQVRKAIFTFAHVPLRILPRDVPKIVRIVEQPGLVTALAYSQDKPDLRDSAEFLLANMSQRMAQALREEVETRGKVKERDGDEALYQVVTAIRSLEASGDLVMLQNEEE